MLYKMRKYLENNIMECKKYYEKFKTGGSLRPRTINVKNNVF